MKKQQNHSLHGRALHVALSIALLSISAVLLASSFKTTPATRGLSAPINPVAAPANTNTPVLVVTTNPNPFSKYYSEILKAEGLNAFQTADIGTVNATVLGNYDTVLLGEVSLTPTQVTTFTDWVNAGGNLIAMKPDKQLAGLLGLTDASSTLADKYLLVNTASNPGAGIVSQTIQFHSSADLYSLNGAASIATLYSDANTATSNPAVTTNTVGTNGGRASAFTYDLAKSVIYTHQGNPAWAGQERDNHTDVIRPDDLFFPDYLDLNRVQIPQADEQQRLLANMITQFSLEKKPLPRFWYLPNGKKAAIVYTVDDHASPSATKNVFNKFIANSPANCSVTDWECIRGTSWFYLGSNLNDSEAAAYKDQGFEMGVHVQNGCTNFTSLAALNQTYTDQLNQFQANFPSLPPQTTHRYHCIPWSDWLSQARAELAHNIRYSMDYYYWPPEWVAGRAGLFTGSGIPMKFADTDGTAIDVYQGVSQLVNENGINYDSDVHVLLTNATGSRGYYGFFGTHDDYRDSTFSDSIVNASQNFNVPVISAKQALTWLDGRNGSSFSDFSWDGTTLNFTVTTAAGSTGLQGMLPAVDSSNRAISSLVRNGSPVTFATQTIKGISYAFFPAATGDYVATYNGTVPTPTPTPPSTSYSLWDNSIVPAVPSSPDDFNAVELGTKFTTDVDGQITGFKFYKGTANTGLHTGRLWTSGGLLLATAIFTNETASGWQEVTLDTPAPVTANTTYIVSYHAPNGRYAYNSQYFTTDYNNAPLHSPASDPSGGNGIFSYGPSGTFPTNTFGRTNYWVDVIFQTGIGPTPTPTGTPTPSVTPSPSPSATPTASPTATPSATPTPSSTPCETNVIACENTLPGDPPSDWQVNGAGDPSIQGFATQMSVTPGQTVSFKVKTPASSYHIDILRVGYYQGNGARKVVSNMQPTATLPQSQPACQNDSAPTGLIDCGNWAVSASWTVPSNAVSGLYLAHLVRDDTGGSSLIPFVVRDDASHSDILFQTDDETWQAYNSQGGNSLYSCTFNCPPGNPQEYKGAAKVSYNRPWHTGEDDNGASWLMYAEYPMIRFLERNGYDVSYTSGLDVSQLGYAPILEQHKVFMSTGHDEYWSEQQRTNVEAALAGGVNLAFFSGNEVFWKTRWEPSIDGSNAPNRTLVTYKETHFDAPVDPLDPPTWTGTWMDPRFSPPADGGLPQNALTGQLFVVNSGTTDIKVPSRYSKLRFWRNTQVASLPPGDSITLDAGVGTLGYEWDVDADNGFRPPGLFDMSATTNTSAEVFTDYGSNTEPNSTAIHHLTLYRAASGALVFGAGTVQWSWGLDNGTGSGNSGGPVDPIMQQATVNLFADMGNVQPATLMAGLTPATQIADTSLPTTTITSPSQGATFADGTAVTVSGTATDAGGGVVAGVEVSTDGTTWHPATTMSAADTSVTWSYSWIAHGYPSTTINARAVDDSGNMGGSAQGHTVNVTCPCSIWGTNVTPEKIDSDDSTSVNVGVKFQASIPGTVTGIRFYKASANTGTHVGELWTAAGQLLASATFTNETGSGWQEVEFSQPVSIDANTTYIASYFAPNGHYSDNNAYFYTTPPMGTNPTITTVNSPPLQAPRNTNGTVNGVYSYSGTPTFPTSTFKATNYWVDPVFSPTSPPTPTPTASATATVTATPTATATATPTSTATPSATATATQAATPAAPTNLTATPVSSSQINLSWTDNSNNEQGFKIERSTNGTNFTQINTVGPNATMVSSVRLAASTTYYYRVRAYNANGNSAYSNIASATTFPSGTPTATATATSTASSTPTPTATASFTPTATPGASPTPTSGPSATPSPTPTATSVPIVQVTVQTNPVGLIFSVDGTTYSSTQTFSWVPGSSHTIATTSPQNGATGVRYVWSSWTGGGAISHTVAPTTNTTYTATFSTQYYLTMTHGTGGSVTPSNGWKNSGTTVSISATPTNNTNVSYRFDAWTGTGTGSYSGTNNPASITMNGPITESAAFIQNPVQVTVQTNLAGLSFSVDGISYTAAQTFSWQPGSSHTIATTSPQSGGTGIRYVWTGWSGGGAISHTVAPTTNKTYTATFNTQYYLTMSHSTGGAVSPASGWRGNGTTVSITATPATNYHFTNWSGSGTGSFSGTSNPASITMGGPITELATFTHN